MPSSTSPRWLILAGLVLVAATALVIFALSEDEPDGVTVDSGAKAAKTAHAVEAPAVETTADLPDTPVEVHRDVVEATLEAAPPAGPPASFAAALGGIVGRVVESDGTPVEGLPLELMGVALDEVFVSVDALFGEAAAWQLGLEKGATRTDEEGRFRFTGVDPGALHALCIDPEGPRADLRLLDATPNSGEERDVGDVVLQPFMTFTGRVVDRSGDPVAGARVRATNIPPIVFQFGAADVHPDGGVLVEGPPNSGQDWAVIRFPSAVETLLRRAPIPSTKTAEDGTFSLAGVPLGVVSVLVDQPEFVTLVHGPVPTGLSGGERNLGTLTLDAGDELGGVVLDGAGRPVPGAEVLVGPHTSIGEFALLRPGDVTNADGRFRVVGLSDDDHFVAARAPDGVDWVILEEASPGSTGLELRFPPAHDLRVLAVDAAGRTLDRPSLVLNEIGEDEALMAAVLLGPRPLRARTTYDEAGAAVVTGLGRGRYRVIVRAEGYAAKDVEADLREGAADLRVELEPARVVHVRVVRGKDGAPVEHAKVLAFERDDDVDVDELPFSTGRTDADGRVALTGIPEQGLNLRVSHPAYAIADLAELSADVEVDVVLLAGGSVKGRVHSGGEPLSAPRFLGLAPDEVVMMPRMSTTDLEGGFEFTRLAPGSYEVVVLPRFAHERGAVDVAQDLMSFGMPERSVQVQVTEGEETWVEIDVLGVDGDVRTANLAGRVLLNGRSAAGATVTAMPMGSWEGRKSTRTDGDGRFQFGKVAIGPAGKVSLMVSPAGVRAEDFWMGGFYTQVLHLPENTSRSVLVDIRTGRLTGRVVRDDDGAAIPNAQVVVRSAHATQGMAFMVDGDEPAEPPPQSEEPTPFSAQVLQSDASGAFDVPLLPDGEYLVEVEAEGYSDARSETVSVQVGGVPPPVVVRMARALTVAGRIVLPEGAPQDGQRWLQFMQGGEGSEGESRNEWTSLDGDRFESDDLGPGEWRVILNVWSDEQEHRAYEATLVVPKDGLSDVVLHLVESGR